MVSPKNSFDLFERRPGWVAELALVVSPYVEKEFFLRIAQDLRPKQLRVVIDDGCRREDLATVQTAVAASGAKRTPKLICRLGSASGLVHIKLFYIVWRTPENRVARTLIYGSANATRQGFSGTVNAELIAQCRLVASRHQPVIDWCEEVITAMRERGQTRIQPKRDIELGKGLQLRLPGLSIGRNVPILSNFDLWIQRGFLLSEYRPDPSFLRVPIQLKRGLAQAEQAKIAAVFGFAVPQTKRLNFAYADPTNTAGQGDDPIEEDEADGAEVGNWRRKLFVWTQLGDWCSEACYDDNQNQFRRRGFERREERLAKLEEHRVEATLAASRKRFLTALSALWGGYGADAPTLLRGGSGVDVNFYAASFDQRVQRDLELVRDEEFRKRYIRGYELVQVPRFRNDVSGWREFVNSLTRQISLDATRARSQSKLLHAVREALETAGEDEAVLDDPGSLLKALRKMWHTDEHGAAEAARIVSDYYLP